MIINKMSMENGLKKRKKDPSGKGFLTLRCERRIIRYKSLDLDIDYYFYKSKDGKQYTDLMTDEINTKNMYIRYGEMLSLIKLSSQVHTLPTLRNKLTPICNLLEMLSMESVKIECTKHSALIEIIQKSIDLSKEMVNDISSPSKLDNTFYDINLE